MPEPGRALPQPTPETKHFWDGTQAGELRLQRCDECRHTYFPPRPFCPKSRLAQGPVHLAASGRAILDSYVIHHRQVRPRLRTALCDRRGEAHAEGPLMMTNIVECAQTPDAVQLDMPLEVVFAKQNDTITLPFFRPAKG